jgi:copper chaperone
VFVNLSYEQSYNGLTKIQNAHQHSLSTKDLIMSQSIQIQVENIKCGGCEKSIVKGLSEISGVDQLQVNRETQTISYVGEPATREAVVAKLLAMGYPEQGSVSGLSAGLANAKSFVSCAIGRMS